MKEKAIHFALLPLLLVFSACAQTAYPAEKSMMEDQFYVSQGSRDKFLSFFQNELVIRDESASALETIEYGKYKLSTKKDTFYLKFKDGTKLKFKRIGERLLEDEDGTIYQPN